MSTKQSSLLRSHPDFMRFWLGQSVSMFGSQVTIIALPLTAVYLLHATPEQMGVFQALATVPFFIFGLFAGVWIDRRRRRPILLWSNVLTAIALAMVPLAAWMHWLSMTALYVVIFIAATMGMVFELAYLSFLPSLVKREDIGEGNSKLETSRALAQVVGPSVSGWLISVLSAPFAIVIDVVSYLYAAIVLMKVKVDEPEPQVREKRKIWSQIGEGLKVIVKHPILRSISSSTAVLNFSRTAFEAVYMLYIVKNLHLTSGEIGLVLGIGSGGALLGAVITNWATKRLGIGGAIIASSVMVFLGATVVTVTTPTLWVALPLLIIGQAFTGLGNTMYFVSQVSLRQAITPNHMLGRVNASNRFISRGAMPIGGLVGGFLGTWLGLHVAITIAAILYVLSIFVLWNSPIRRVKTIQQALEYQEQAAATA